MQWAIFSYDVINRYNIRALFFLQTLTWSNLLHKRTRHSYLEDRENSNHCLKEKVWAFAKWEIDKYLESNVKYNFCMFSVFKILKI